VDSAREQKKPEARKMLDAKRAAESPASSARDVGLVLQDGFEFELDIFINHHK